MNPKVTELLVNINKLSSKIDKSLDTVHNKLIKNTDKSVDTYEWVTDQSAKSIDKLTKVLKDSHEQSTSRKE